MTWQALQGALVGPLEEHLTEQAILVADLRDRLNATAVARTNDRQEIARVQAALREDITAARAKLDVTEGAMAAEFGAIRAAVERGRTEREAHHAELVAILTDLRGRVDCHTAWQGRHEAWHDGVREGKHDTGETVRVAAAVAAGQPEPPPGPGPLAEAVAAALPPRWRRYAPWLIALGGLVAALLQAASGCVPHPSPAEERIEAVGTSAAVQCLAAPLAQCAWGAGAQGYWRCLLNAAVPCAVEHAAQAAEAGVALVYEHYGVRMVGVDPGEAARRRGAEVLACFEGVDVGYVVEHCPDGKAPRLCLVDAATFCLDGQAELQ